MSVNLYISVINYKLLAVTMQHLTPIKNPWVKMILVKYLMA